MTEEIQRKRYMGFSMKGAEWLSKELQKRSEKRDHELSHVETNLRLRWIDNQATISVIIRKNCGKIAQIEIFPVYKRMKHLDMCPGSSQQ